MFGYESTNTSGKARRGTFHTPHGPVQTPAFMPVGTAGSVKGITPDQLRTTGTEMILANTYHLLLRPGPEGVSDLGGLHSLMAWEGPILTDSGGYQVFSLAHLRTLQDDGVTFRSHLDGSEVVLTPARAVDIQRHLGSDVMMQLDECPPAGADESTLRAAVDRSARWAALARDAWDAAGRVSRQGHPQALFGIQQGGTNLAQRASSAEALVRLDLPGYAVGGLSVGEGHDAMCRVLEETDSLFPVDRPRYLMGVGEPRDILAAVQRGIDLFDCVLPTRNGRNAQAFTFAGRLRLRNARFAGETQPIEEGCDCYACRHFSQGTIRHLFMAGEMLGPILTTIHNLRFFARFMAGIRDAIATGDLDRRAHEWTRTMDPDTPEAEN